MDTVILALNDGSCHDNKSQRADPFVCLTRIIADKTKHVKDPFWRQILRKGRHGKGYRPSEAFWEKWGNARTNRTETKEEWKGKWKDALREF